MRMEAGKCGERYHIPLLAARIRANISVALTPQRLGGRGSSETAALSFQVRKDRLHPVREIVYCHGPSVAEFMLQIAAEHRRKGLIGVRSPVCWHSIYDV